MQPTGVLETSKATKNPLKELLNYGQSMWLDYIRRDLFTTGKLKQLITDDGLRGMTSNPAIFEKAIADSSLYDDFLKTLACAQRSRHHRPLRADRHPRHSGCGRRAASACMTNPSSATDT